MKIKFNDGHEYDFDKHMALQDLSPENIKDVMKLIKRLHKGGV